jgi:colanic acid/amylovoran biosynthesis glycosyltransferase
LTSRPPIFALRAAARSIRDKLRFAARLGTATKSGAKPPTEAAPAKIGYLCSMYPAVTHTFVLREVCALRELGADIDTFSVRRAGSDQLLASADWAAFESTFAILPPDWTALLSAHLRLIVTSSGVYLSTLALAWRMAPPGLRGHLWQLFYFVESVLLWRECERRKVRHLHAHMAHVAADVALLTANIGSGVEPKRPWSWSLTMHGPFEFFDVSHFRLSEKLRRVSFVACISDYARSQLMALSERDVWDRLHVVHVGIPIEQFTREDDASLPQADATILFIGRLVAVKGQTVLLEAAALLAARGHKVNVIVAGEGPLRPTLERLAERLGLASHVSFPGAVGQDEIHALYSRASIFCLPSFAEGVPCVLMEAMAMELPVVSTRITGVPELVDDGRTGILVAPGRVDQLADALERLLVDPGLRCQMGSLAREKVVQEFNSQKSAKGLHDLFARYVYDGERKEDGRMMTECERRQGS